MVSLLEDPPGTGRFGRTAPPCHGSRRSRRAPGATRLEHLPVRSVHDDEPPDGYRPAPWTIG
ncbi:hypothetical protein ACFPM0_20820 [Pseudonocardia sulfidoxydans]|uniref:hypothetical protein n=1 Tax=Pseudonocardia sulfidoxydans TaxID=54011 RepID=UPI003612B396